MGELGWINGFRGSDHAQMGLAPCWIHGPGRFHRSAQWVVAGRAWEERHAGLGLNPDWRGADLAPGLGLHEPGSLGNWISTRVRGANWAGSVRIGPRASLHRSCVSRTGSMHLLCAWAVPDLIWNWKRKFQIGSRDFLVLQIFKNLLTFPKSR